MHTKLYAHKRPGQWSIDWWKMWKKNQGTSDCYISQTVFFFLPPNWRSCYGLIFLLAFAFRLYPECAMNMLLLYNQFQTCIALSYEMP